MKTLTIILLVIIAALVAAVIYLIVSRPKVVEISDGLPNSRRRRDCWLKLQNEGKHYLMISDDTVSLLVVKPKKK